MTIGDDQLMELYAGGDAAAFELLFERHAGLVFNFAWRMLGSGAEAEEVLQDSFLVNGAVAGVLAQRLARRVCPGCAAPVTLDLEVLPGAARAFLAGRDLSGLCKGTGCPRCHGTGYRGRMALHEILVMDDTVRQAIAHADGVDALRDATRQAGMRSLAEDGLLHALAGGTSIEEVLRIVPLEG